MAEKKAKTKGVVSVDFTGVESGGGSFRVPPGDYAVKIKVGKLAKSQKGFPKIAWELEGVNGAIKGKKIMFDTSLQEQALFKLRNMLLACKVDVPQSTMKIDLDKMKGLVFGVVIDDDEYKGKTKSQIIDTFPVTVKKDGKMIKEEMAEDEDDYDEDEEDDIEDVDEDEESVDYDDLSDKELKALCKDRDIKVKKSWDKDKMVAALEAYDEANGDDEEDDE